MKHLVWGGLSLAIGAIFLLSTLVLANVSVASGLVYGGIFVAHGIYRLNQYRSQLKQ